MAKVPGAGKPDPRNQTPVNPLLPGVPEDGKLNTNQGHRVSDVDSSKLSQHHTLGTGANQSSPGNHTHNGIDSKLINQFTDSTKILTWNPVWFSSGSPDPIIGNGTLEGYYVRWGFQCFFTIRWVAGSTSTYGTGAYFFTAPFFCFDGPYFQISGIMSNGGYQYPIIGQIHRSYANLFYLTPASGRFEGLNSANGVSVGSGGWKQAWVSGDWMTFSGWIWIDLEQHPL